MPLRGGKYVMVSISPPKLDADMGCGGCGRGCGVLKQCKHIALHRSILVAYMYIPQSFQFNPVIVLISSDLMNFSKSLTKTALLKGKVQKKK